MASNLALNLQGFVATQPLGSVDRGIAEFILEYLERVQDIPYARCGFASPQPGTSVIIFY